MDVANADIVDLMEWLKFHNKNAREIRLGFTGLTSIACESLLKQSSAT